MFVWTAIGLVVLAAGCHLFVTLVLYPTAIYWMPYYVPNYEFGFVRRGLGGEVIRMLPHADNFPATCTMMWAPVVRKEAGLRHVRLHGLRNTGITPAVAAHYGVDLQ